MGSCASPETLGYPVSAVTGLLSQPVCMASAVLLLSFSFVTVLSPSGLHPLVWERWVRLGHRSPTSMSDGELIKDTPKTSGDVLEVDVAVIGNGPSALALSAVLSGLVPRVKLGTSQYIRDRNLKRAAQALEKVTGGLDEVDLSLWAKGIQRRCVNPTAALIDALRFPDGDGMGQSVLSFDQRKKPISHVLIGSGPPGGSWHEMSATTQSLSPGFWMDLPGKYSLAAHLDSSEASEEARSLSSRAGGVHSVTQNRVPRWVVAEYYAAYAARHVPRNAFLQGVVNSLSESAGSDESLQQKRWTLNVTDANRAFQRSVNSEGKVAATVRAKAVVLAGGIYDKPVKLNVSGETLPWVFHRVSTTLNFLTQSNSPRHHLLVVGAGLSAADSIISAFRRRNAQKEIRISHVFRQQAPKTKIGKMFGTRLPSDPTYGEEALLAKLMAGTARDEWYKPYSETSLAKIHDDGSCVLSSGPVLKDVTAVAILIGSGPNLDFLPPSISHSLLKDPNSQQLRTDGQPSSHPCFVDVDPATFEVLDASRVKRHVVPGLFAMGPLRGDNFVRFITGDSLAIRRRLSLHSDSSVTD